MLFNISFLLLPNKFSHMLWLVVVAYSHSQLSPPGMFSPSVVCSVQWLHMLMPSASQTHSSAGINGRCNAQSASALSLFRSLFCPFPIQFSHFLTHKPDIKWFEYCYTDGCFPSIRTSALRSFPKKESLSSIFFYCTSHEKSRALRS